jgi:CheY-like chemotaxis protein
LPIALVVDDSMLIRHSVCRFLEQRGYEVRAAANGIEALRALEQARPDVLITDIEMPEMGGMALIAKLRSMPEYSSIPIVVLAARRTASAAPISGVDAIVYKDIDIDEQLARALQPLHL